MWGTLGLAGGEAVAVDSGDEQLDGPMHHLQVTRRSHQHLDTAGQQKWRYSEWVEGDGQFE